MAAAVLPLMIGTAIASAVGTVASARAQANAMKYNAQLAEQNAQIARDQGAAEAARMHRVGRQAVGGMANEIGSNGLAMEGTALDVLESSAQQAEMDVLTTKYNYELKARGFENEAEMNRWQAKQTQQAGYLSAAGQLLNSASKVASAGQSLPTG